MRHDRRFPPSNSIFLLLTLCTACGEDDPAAGAVEIESFAVDLSEVSFGESVTLTWSAKNVRAVTIVAAPGGILLDASPEAAGTIVSAPLDEKTDFILTVLGQSGDRAESRVTVDVSSVAARILRFSANPNPAPTGGTVVLSWVTENARRVRVLRAGQAIVDTMAMVDTGSAAIQLATTSTVFVLEASNAAGQARQDLVVTALAPPTISTFTASPLVLETEGSTITLAWSTAGASELRLTANGGEIANVSGVDTGTFDHFVDRGTTFMLIAVGPGGRVTATASVSPAAVEVEPNETPQSATVLDGAITAQLTPNDVDVYAVTVPASGSILAKTNAGNGACNVDTVLALLDLDGATLLGEDDDGGDAIVGAGACSRIDPQRNAFARDLPAGVYYLRVTGKNSDVGPYRIEASIIAPECGNRLIEASTGETCDDGNRMSGDGCSALCQYDGPTESEPNDATNTATPVGTVIRGRIESAAAEDWYVFFVPDGASLQARLTAPGPQECGAGFGAEMTLVAPDGVTQLLVVAGNGPGASCAAVDPLIHRAAFQMAAGTYYLLISNTTATAPHDYYLRVVAGRAACGNGLVEGQEQCDDRNMVGGDGCNASCELEIAATLAPPGGEATFSLAAQPSFGAVRVDLDRAGQSIGAVTSDGAGGCMLDTRLTILTSTFASLGGKSDGARIPCAAINPAQDLFASDLAVGAYYVVIDNEGPNAGSAQLVVSVMNPRCGNGITEQRDGETCDDSNMSPNDGCDASCQVEGSVVSESEPNGMRTNANDLGVATPGRAVASGDLLPAGDLDYYAFDVPSGRTATLVARTQATASDANTCPGDTRLTLYDAAGMALATDEDGGFMFCSLIDGTASHTGAAGLTPGRYYVAVAPLNMFTSVPGYVLTVELR